MNLKIFELKAFNFRLDEYPVKDVTAPISCYHAWDKKHTFCIGNAHHISVVVIAI